MNPPLPLAWRDAMAAVPPGIFTPAEKAAGWPQALQPAQLAWLQRPLSADKDQAYKACLALQQAIADAMASGELPHTVQQHSTPARWELRPSLFDVYSNWDHPANDGAHRHVPAKSWQTHHIAPADARAWLVAQGEAPSPHVVAWFASASLQPAEVGAPAAAAPQPAPAKERRILRKRELAQELSGNWPSIAKDLHEGRAKDARRGRGLYDVDAAVRWAKENGRWKDRSESNVVPFASTWPGKVTKHRMDG